jgi:hypothetical protein
MFTTGCALAAFSVFSGALAVPLDTRTFFSAGAVYCELHRLLFLHLA